MELPSNKELARIVKLCRKHGIKVFECGELRITLSDNAFTADINEKATRGRRSILGSPVAPKGSIQSNNVPDSMPDETELLFASVGGPPPEMFEQ